MRSVPTLPGISPSPDGPSDLDIRIATARPDELRSIVLDNPLARWHEPRVRELFGRLVATKVASFGEVYEPGSLPVSTHDFIATHLLGCLRTSEGWQPVGAFWFLDSQRCQAYERTFVAEHLARTARSPLHHAAIAAARKRWAARGRSLSHVDGWALHPATRKNPALRQALREHFLGLQILANRAVGISNLITPAVLRFGMDRFLESAGYRPLRFDGEILPPIRIPHLRHADVRMMILEADHELAVKAAERVLPLWTRRVEIGVAAHAFGSARPGPRTTEDAATEPSKAERERLRPC